MNANAIDKKHPLGKYWVKMQFAPIRHCWQPSILQGRKQSVNANTYLGLLAFGNIVDSGFSNIRKTGVDQKSTWVIGIFPGVTRQPDMTWEDFNLCGNSRCQEPTEDVLSLPELLG